MNSFLFIHIIYIYIYTHTHIKPDPLVALSQKIKTFADFKTLNGHKIVNQCVMNSFLFIHILYINRSNPLAKVYTLRWGKLIDKLSLSFNIIMPLQTKLQLLTWLSFSYQLRLRLVRRNSSYNGIVIHV